MIAGVTSDPKEMRVRGAFGFPWQPDCGDGTYRNPVIYADYSDPDVIRVGDDFFMTASSFNCTPGLPILHSRDLVNWRIVNHALKRVPDARYDEVQPGCGVWAPAIRHHAGKFWIFFPTPDEGIYVVTAEDAFGQWSEPHLVQAGKGLIDPCPLWDDDGKAYLVHAYANSRSGIKHVLRVRPMAPDGSKLLGDGQVVFEDPVRHPTLEGPKFLKRNGWYYISAPAGGVQTGWQVILRSRNIYGPYEDRTVLHQGDTDINGPHQGALLDTADGRWWFMHFQDVDICGRILHLQPVVWKDGWPLPGAATGKGIGVPVRQHVKPDGVEVFPAVPQTSDDFESAELGLQWQWQANYRRAWFSLTARPGWLRLHAQKSPEGDLARCGNLVLQKFPAPSFAVETDIEFSPGTSGDEAGLVVAGRTCAALAMRRTASRNLILFRNDGADQVLGETASARLMLRIEVGGDGICTLSYAAGGGFIPVPEKFQATAGVWMGAKVGLYAICRAPNSAGHADFKYFRFQPAGSPSLH